MEIYDKEIKSRVATALGINTSKVIFSLKKVKGGWNVRTKAINRLQKVHGKSTLHQLFKPHELYCKKCHKIIAIHPHHIISKNRGGGDDKDNLLILCFGCHVGDEGIHKGKWKIEELISNSHMLMLKKRYNLL